MLRKRTRIFVALPFVVFAVFGASVWLTTRIPETEGPPCKNCSYGSNDIPTVPLCELLANHSAYRGRLIRVRAILHNDSGDLSFRDKSCQGSGSIHLKFVDRCGSCVGAGKALTIYTGWGLSYEGSARVTAVGTVNEVENSTESRFSFDRFVVQCLEGVEPINPTIGFRIRYTIEQALRRLH